MTKPRTSKRHVIGLGLDGHDGHLRITRGENFSLFLGSEATHERMQETCIKLNETLKRKGRSLDQLSPRQVEELLREHH